MPQGIYKAIKRRKEANSTLMLTHNLQVWLAIFAFTSFIFINFLPSIWRWVLMFTELSPIEWFAFFLGSVFLLFFALMGIYSLFNVLKLLWRAKFGELVEYDESWPQNILAAITPVEAKTKKKESHLPKI